MFVPFNTCNPTHSELFCFVDAAAVAAAAAVANKAAYSTTYTTVPTTRQLTVPPITPKNQNAPNSSPYAAQYSQQTSVAPNYYNAVAPGQNVVKVSFCLKRRNRYRVFDIYLEYMFFRRPVSVRSANLKNNLIRHTNRNQHKHLLPLVLAMSRLKAILQVPSPTRLAIQL